MAHLSACMAFFCICLVSSEYGKNGSTVVNHTDPLSSSTPRPKPSLDRLKWAWKKIIPNDGYDETLPPSQALTVVGGKVVPVPPWIKVEIIPLFVTQISMKTMDYNVDVSSSLEWEDDRLDNSSFPVQFLEVDVPKTFIAQLWVPKVLFANSKGSDPNVGSMDGLKFTPQSKRFIVQKRRTLNFMCVYNFKNYPFDVQQCSIQLLYEHSRQQYVNMEMNYLSARAVRNIHLPPEFKLMTFTTAKCTNYSFRTITKHRCEYVFSFRRIYTQHILLVFTPSILIVVLSWIAFILPVETAAPRVALGLTTLLTLITQLNAAQKDLPAVAEVKALDIWMFVCIIMVFAALLEFALSYIYDTIKKANSAKTEVLDVRNRIPKYVNVVGTEVVQLRKEENPAPKFAKQPLRKLNPIRAVLCPSYSNVIDGTARIVFPLIFLIFNITFWSHYLTQPKL